MSESRKEVIRLLDLPLEITTEACPRAIAYTKGTQFMAALSNTCHTFYQCFQHQLDQRAAQQLLALILKPTKANLNKAKEMYCTNPKLLFIESIAKEYAAGLDENLKNVHRTVKASPIRAMAGADDGWLFQETVETDEFKQYVDPVSKKGAFELAADELKKQFPDGFAFPPSTYDYSPLLYAITHDQSLIQHNVPSEITNALLAQFRKDFLPNTIITSGYFFNFNELVMVLELYEEYEDGDSTWEENQLSLFWCQVIGYLERLVTGVTGEVISQGIHHVIDGQPPARKYAFDNHISGKREFYFPLANHSSSRLGLSFAVDSEQPVRGNALAELTFASLYKIYAEKRQEIWSCLYYMLRQHEPNGCLPSTYVISP